MQLTQLHTHSYPKRIILLEPASNREQTDDISEQAYTFRHTSLIVLNHREEFVDGVQSDEAGVRQIGRYKFSRPLTCGSIYQLTETLDQLLYWKSKTWIIVRQGGYDLALSGILKLFEEGHFQIKPSSSKQQDEENEDYFAPKMGALAVFADPPILIEAKWHNGRTALMLSLDNYLSSFTVELGASVADTRSRADRIARSYQLDIETTEKAVTRLAITFANLLKESELLGNLRFGMTAGGCAINLYRSRYMVNPPKPHERETIRRLERESFRGGETRAFRVGKHEGMFTLVDANSLYPFIMASFTLPKELIDYSDEVSWKKPSCLASPAASIAEVWLDTDKQDYQVRKDNRTLYCIGSFRTVLCGPELQRACELGHVRAVRWWARYSLDLLFRDYVIDLYRQRLAARRAGDNERETACKLMLNALFGKFGQRSAPMIHKPGVFAPCNWGSATIYNQQTMKAKKEWYIGGQVFREGERLEVRGAIPHVSSFIVSAARLYMQSIREIIGPENVYYQGVDSLLLTSAGVDKLHENGLIDQDELGKLKVKAFCKSIEIMGSNTYYIDGKPVVQGLAGGYDIVNSNEYKIDHVQRLGSLIHTLESERVKVTKRKFSHPSLTVSGSIMDDNWVLPFELIEDKPFQSDWLL